MPKKPTKKSKPVKKAAKPKKKQDLTALQNGQDNFSHLVIFECSGMNLTGEATPWFLPQLRLQFV